LSSQMTIVFVPVELPNCYRDKPLFSMLLIFQGDFFVKDKPAETSGLPVWRQGFAFDFFLAVAQKSPETTSRF